MNVILVINQSDVEALPIAILKNIREVVQLYVLNFIKVLRLVTSCYSELSNCPIWVLTCYGLCHPSQHHHSSAHS